MMDGFDYVVYLKRSLMVGQVDPWRTYDDGSKIYTLLVTTEIAMEECKLWSNQEFTRKAFIDYLKDNGVIVFKNTTEFSKYREESKEFLTDGPLKFKKGGKKKISDERREELRNRMISINKVRKASV